MSTTTVLVIDVQQDYFPGGAFALVGPEAAAAAGSRVLAWARGQGHRVVHVQHADPDPEATFLAAGSDGARIHPLLAPLDGEDVVTKAEPNAFVGTDLADRLDGVERLVVLGMMSSMCVDATVRAAADQGLSVTVVQDACAAPDLTFKGRTVPGADVHAAFMAALASAYAEVVDAVDLVD
jgi:nicotinamidase-related amidase